MAGLFDFLTGGSGGGLLGLGPRQSSALDPDYYLQRAQPSMGLLEGGGLMGGLRGALQALGDPGGKRQQQALQNYIILKEMQNKEAASKQFGEGLSGYLGGQQPAAPAAPAGMPRGIRNNNPLNIEAGAFTQGLPGFAGSDGRFARFEQPQQGIDAASKLLDVYQNKHGLNTVRGIISRWAPAAEAGNNTSGYVASVAGRLGVDPDQPLGPQHRQALIAAMGQFENGRPIQMANNQAALPPNAQPAQGFAIPGQQPEQPQMSPKAAGLIRMLANPNLDAGQRKLGETLLAQELDQSKRTDDIREFEYAKRQGFTGTLEQWIQRKRSGAGEYGLQPIWGTDPATGEPAIIQLGKGGEAVRSKIPDNIKVGKDVIRIDAGTHTILLDPVTRQPIGQVSKNIEQTQAAEKRGAAQGEAQVNLGGVVNQADLALKTIEQIRSHPGKSFGTGVTGILPGIPGTNQRGFVALVDQAKGQTFLTAFERLKGAGAITETEGLKATQAIGRLDRAQSAADFETALKDLESVIKVGVERAKQKAGAAPDAGGWTEINGVRIREKR